MKKLCKLPKMLWISLFLSLASCAHTKIYDKEVCGDLGMDGAHCNHTLQQKPRDIPKPQWDLERVGWMCMDSEGYNDTETAIDQLCNSSAKCDYVMRQKIEDLKVRLRDIAETAKMARAKYFEQIRDENVDPE